MKSYPVNFGELAYNEANKTRFLNQTRALLRTVADQLQQEHAIEAYHVSVNKAGIAVGGDVYAYLYGPGLRYGLLITITHSCVSRDREDGVVCYGQYRRPYPNETKTMRGTTLPIIGQIIGSNEALREPISGDAVKGLVRHMLFRHPDKQRAA